MQINYYQINKSKTSIPFYQISKLYKYIHNYFINVKSLKQFNLKNQFLLLNFILLLLFNYSFINFYVEFYVGFFMLGFILS